MLQPQNERFVRDFLKCSCFVAPCRRFPNFLFEFSTSKSMFCARRPSSSAHLTKCRACHGICTLSPLDADLTIRFAKTRHTARLKCCVYAAQNGDGGLQSAAPATKNAAHLLETMQRYCACHTKRLSTRYQTVLNVAKCHTCHAKRSYATFGTSKSDPLCRTHHRHGHSDLARTVVNNCRRLHNVGRTHPQPPQAPRVKWEPLLRIRE